MSKIFPSRWPIVLAGMNGGSDKKLALAVAESGGFPSLFVTPSMNIVKLAPDSPLSKRDLDFDPMYYELLDFIKCKGDSNFSVPISAKWLLYPQFLTIAKDLQISNWDIFPRWEADQICCSDLIEDRMIFQGIKYLRQFSHVMGRLLHPSRSEKLKIFSVLGVIGTDTGGGQGALPVKEFFDQQIATFPNTIPHGSIGTPHQVKNFIDAGACAVAVGTLFAACAESPLSTAVKEKMVLANEVTQINGDHKQAKIKQNALVFDTDSVTDDADTSNHCGALYTGIKGDGTQGLIMAGTSIKHVDRIRTVQETMDYLTSELKQSDFAG